MSKITEYLLAADRWFNKTFMSRRRPPVIKRVEPEIPANNTPGGNTMVQTVKGVESRRRRRGKRVKALVIGKVEAPVNGAHVKPEAAEAESKPKTKPQFKGKFPKGVKAEPLAPEPKVIIRPEPRLSRRARPFVGKVGRISPPMPKLR